jgi:hypothetical protein
LGENCLEEGIWEHIKIVHYERGRVNVNLTGFNDVLCLLRRKEVKKENAKTGKTIFCIQACMFVYHRLLVLPNISSDY